MCVTINLKTTFGTRLFVNVKELALARVDNSCERPHNPYLHYIRVFTFANVRSVPRPPGCDTQIHSPRSPITFLRLRLGPSQARTSRSAHYLPAGNQSLCPGGGRGRESLPQTSGAAPMRRCGGSPTDDQRYASAPLASRRRANAPSS